MWSFIANIANFAYLKKSSIDYQLRRSIAMYSDGKWTMNQNEI